MRRPFAFAPLLAVFLGGLAVVGCRRPSPPAESLLLVTLDTLRADRLGVYGYAAAETPHLDALAAQGVRFAAASAAAPLTLPSHATILSGLLPPRHGVRLNGAGAFPEDAATLATALAARGLRTGAFVAAFVLDRRFGLARGFEVYDDEVGDGGAARRLEAERGAERVVERAVAWLRAEPARPFFLWVHLFDAHAPYEPPEPFRSRHPGRPYDGEVARVDAAVGLLLAALDELGLAATTAVAVAGDHGEALGEHGEASHGLFLYQPSLHVPWLLRAPDLPAGTVVETPVGLADLAPTVAGLLGASLPAADGRDLAPLLRAGGRIEATDVYAESEYPRTFGWAGLAALRRGDVKAVLAPRPELYDLAADPAEAEDLAEGRRRDLRPLLDAVEATRRDARAAGDPAADAESRARLEALGYAGGGVAEVAEAADPKDRRELFAAWEEAHRAAALGRLDEALPELRRLARADPANPVFRGELARALRRSGDLEGAVVEYREAAARASADPGAWYDLASALHDAGRFPESIAAAEEALRRDPRRTDAANLLGLAALARGDLAAAEAAFRRAAALDPRDATAENNLGNVLRARGDRGGAEAAYRRAGELAPRWADPWNGLGALAVEAGRAAAAIELFDRALALDPAAVGTLLNRGIALELAGRRAEAAAAYREVLARAAAGSPEAGAAMDLLSRRPSR